MGKVEKVDKIRLVLLRGVCQTPAYVAHDEGFFAREGLRSAVAIAPTAWMVPEQLVRNEADFAVIPWTRVAVPGSGEEALRLVAGSGYEEAAIVVRKGLTLADVRSVAVPREGGMKALTVMALIHSLGWTQTDLVRCPSGDGAIIALFGGGADAAAMVEPYATMLESMGGRGGQANGRHLAGRARVLADDLSAVD